MSERFQAITPEELFWADAYPRPSKDGLISEFDHGNTRAKVIEAKQIYADTVCAQTVDESKYYVDEHYSAIKPQRKELAERKE